MRARIPVPDDFYCRLAKGEESLRCLGKRFGVSDRTIRRWWDDKAEAGGMAEITRDFAVPFCFDTLITLPLRTGKQVRVINVGDNDADVGIEEVLNALRVPLNALWKNCNQVPVARMHAGLDNLP